MEVYHKCRNQLNAKAQLMACESSNIKNDFLMEYSIINVLTQEHDTQN